MCHIEPLNKPREPAEPVSRQTCFDLEGKIENLPRFFETSKGFMTVYLVTGYRKTGKDTLYQVLTGQIAAPSRMAIYSLPVKIPRWPGSCFQLERIAFADHLKTIIGNIRGIEESTLLNQDKDQVLSTGKTFREECIQFARVRRSLDPDYFVRIGFQDRNRSNDYMVTDWRFPNENEYLIKNGWKVVTLRVYRSEVPIPPDEDETEHSLDSVQTDFLIIPESDSFETVISVFPQYRDYIRIL